MLSRLVRHSIWLLLARLGTQLGAALFTILLARRLGTAGFGEYAFIAAIIFVENALTTFGTDMLLIREIAARADLSRLANALQIQLVLSIALIAMAWLFGAWIPNQNPEVIVALKIYSLALIPMAFFTVFTTALRGKQHMNAYMFLNLAFSILQVATVVFHRINLPLLSILLVGVQSITAILAGIVCSAMIPGFGRGWRFTLWLPPSFLKDIAPLAGLTVLTILYQRLGVVMLSLMTTPTQTGIFSAALRILEASKTMHLAVFAALYPAMSQAQTDLVNQSRWKESFRASWKILLAGAILIALMLFSISRWLITLFYGDQFSEATAILQILSWTLIPFTINTYLTLAMLASNREHLVGRALTISLLSLLVLNAWWIPLHGPGGSAAAALIAECLQCAALLTGRKSVFQLRGDIHEFSKLS